MAVVMHKLEAIKFLEARLAAIEREHNDELASEGTRSEADARAEAKALAATYDFLKDCKIPHRQSLLRVLERAAALLSHSVTAAARSTWRPLLRCGSLVGRRSQGLRVDPTS